jgi:hypothetical protein
MSISPDYIPATVVIVVGAGTKPGFSLCLIDNIGRRQGDDENPSGIASDANGHGEAVSVNHIRVNAKPLMPFPWQQGTSAYAGR